MNRSSAQPRRPQGTPVGGQFDRKVGNHPEINLTETYIEGRSAAIVAGRYITPMALQFADPRGAVRRRQWWDLAEWTQEHNHHLGDYPSMPEQLADGRRVNLRTYDNDHAAIRMPSASAVRTYAAGLADPKTFDLPIEYADADGRMIRISMRVTALAGGHFHVTAPNGSNETRVRAAEAARAVLEAQRPLRALRDIGDLLQRHKDRVPNGVFKMAPVESSFIEAVGYEPVNGEMLVAMKAGKVYNYKVPDYVFDAVIASPSVGRAYTRYVKGAPRADVEMCRTCRQWASVEGHVCEDHGSRPFAD